MKRISLNIALCSALAMVSVLANAREFIGAPNKGNSHISFKTEAGDCGGSTASFDLDVNNVRAKLLAGGDMWWNLSEAKYEVPKSDQTGTSINAIFAGAIWITGLDAAGNLKCAAQRYRASGDDYWPGPLSAGVIDRATCNKYDRFFNVLGTNITLAQNAFSTKGTDTRVSDIPKDVLSWPAKGNPYISSDASLVGETFDITENLAPFKDVDGDGSYDPVKGDYPVIPCRSAEPKAFADQMIFWVFNDKGNLHSETQGLSIGIQVNALAFAFQTTDDINNMTFYKYEIVNKSPNRLFSTYISQWVDPDLGCFDDDRVGCDVGRSIGIVYNGKTPDNPQCSNGVGNYGSQLPMLGVDFFEGPLDDHGNQLGLSSFVYFNNSPDPKRSDPSTPQGYRNYQTGRWNDGTQVTYGGDGAVAGNPPTNYVFPGNPAHTNEWSECTAVNPSVDPADRRFVETSGPFTLVPGVSQYVTVGCVFVRPTGGVGLCPDFDKTIGPADDKAQQLFNTCFKLVDGPDAPTLSIRELSDTLIVNFLNLPQSNNFGEGYDEVDGGTLSGVLQELGGHGDSTYTFEGYKFYQVTSPKVSASDLDDPDKATEIAEVDVKNGIKVAPTYIIDPTLGILVPTWVESKSLQAGNDAGTQSSWLIDQDYFTKTPLINHKIYYYTAIAFAYNNYSPYNPITGAGQKTTYLQGRGNFKIYSAIPHTPDPRNMGTILNSRYGDGVEVKRIEGQGNGGNNLQLTPESVERILSSGSYAFLDTLVYAKGHDPIGFQITDPVNLKEADFELHFYDTISTTTIGSTTRWFLYDVTDNDTIWSERTLDRPYQQQVQLTKNARQTDYGFSIKLGTPATLYTIPGDYLAAANSPNRYVYGADATQSSIIYQNPTQPWLSFVKDAGAIDVSNWIRSGTTAYNPSATTNPNPTTRAAGTVFDDNSYYVGSFSTTPPVYPNLTFDDSLQVFDKIAGGTWAPYCLSANYSNSGASGLIPPYVYGPGFKWRYYGNTQAPPQNTLDRVASVDVVITADPKKWSRCVVFETGEDNTQNVGGAHKGQIRMSVSKVFADKNHLDNPDNARLVDDPFLQDTGRSYFPGYAINVETGERLNIAFGESSDMSDQNGRDMLWNPSQNVYSPIYFPNQLIPQLPFFGGKHFIYVMDTKYDEGDSAKKIMLDNVKVTGAQGGRVPTGLVQLYLDLMWTSIPYVTPGYNFKGDGTSTPAYIPPADVTVKLRVDKPYGRRATISTNSDLADSLPRYQFSTKGLGATEGNQAIAKTALDLIKIVPNPYLAYSAYETDQNSSIVKITNLPNNCTVTIYSLDGTLIRRLTRAIDVDPATNRKVELSGGVSTDQTNVESSLDWDLKNDKSIPIASGIYLFHIEAPGLGQKTLKWFGAVRPADTSNF